MPAQYVLESKIIALIRFLIYIDIYTLNPNIYIVLSKVEHNSPRNELKFTKITSKCINAIQIHTYNNHGHTNDENYPTFKRFWMYLLNLMNLDHFS